MASPRLRLARLCSLALMGLIFTCTPLFAQDDSAPAPEAPAAAKPAAADEDSGKWMRQMDGWFGNYIVTPLDKALFYDFGTGPPKDWDGNVLKDEAGNERVGWLGEGKTSVPFVVVWLMIGAVYLTVRMLFINVRAFWHAIRVTKGDYDDPDDEGEVTHFQALSSALSATVGLGNIAGVAIAVGSGGPGAVFWMIMAGLFGMTSKFTECTLGQMYRSVDNEGRVLGGPMRYLKEGLAEKGMAPLGAILAVMFAILCIGGSVGGGCAFQVSQSLDVVKLQFTWLEDQEWIYGVVMAVMVGIVILGGIRRIAATAEKIVPLMCGVYVVASLYIIGSHYNEITGAFRLIFEEAFKWESAYGGLLGVMVIGIRRAAFSNEAGVGSAAIAHSAAKTNYPAREGIVALLEPFIDTVVICTMTGLVIVITGVYDTERFPQYAEMIANDQGAQLTSRAFGSVVPWFPYILSIAAFLFAYSTMISWSYYGERSFTYLFGQRGSLPYRIMFVGCVFMGSIITATNAKNFSDLMILSMAVPNILGLLLLSGKVKLALDDYWTAYKMGDYDRKK